MSQGLAVAEEFKKRINIDDWQLAFGQRAEHRLLMADLWGRALYEHHAAALRLPVQAQDSLFATPTKAYVRKTQRAEVLAAIRKALTDDGDAHLQYVRDATMERVRGVEEHVERLARALPAGRQEDRELLSTLWQEHDAEFLRTIPWFYVPWYLVEENLVTDRVRAGLRVHREAIASVVDPAQALPLLIAPTKRMLFQEEQEVFFRLVALAEQTREYETNASFRRQAEEYLTGWSWTTTLAFLPLELLSFDQLLERIRDALAKNARADYDQLQRARTKSEKQAATLLRVLAKDQQLTTDIEWAREFGWLLTWSVECFIRAASRLHPFYQAVARALGVPWSDLTQLVSAEITEGLNRKLPVSAEELARRRQGYVYVLRGGQASFVTGPDARRVAGLLTEHLERADRSVSELRGQPVSAGTARGQVRICPTPQDTQKVGTGDILVCSMTSPDYLSAMRRAGAIVTDEGGLLSHAAIVSREFGKPCVVGTKVASRVLKDGDEVDVDAKLGVVRILRRS